MRRKLFIRLGIMAAAVLMVANLPPRANVAELVIKPTTQAFC